MKRRQILGLALIAILCGFVAMTPLILALTP